MSKSSNPYAFPVPNDANVNGQMGMSLRDWFAGMALNGYCSVPDERRCPQDICTQGKDAIAVWQNSMITEDVRTCYRLADKMLEVRETTPTT